MGAGRVAAVLWTRRARRAYRTASDRTRGAPPAGSDFSGPCHAGDGWLRNRDAHPPPPLGTADRVVRTQRVRHSRVSRALPRSWNQPLYAETRRMGRAAGGGGNLTV